MILNCISLSFDFVQSQMALDTIRAAIYDIKEWLLLNMLKFNTSKTDLGDIIIIAFI